MTSIAFTRTLNAETPSAAEWEFADGDENVSVYYRTLPGGNVEFKGITTVKTRLDVLVAIFSDLDNMPNWVYRTRSIVKLDEVSENEKYLYSIHNMPFPFKQRDSIILSTLYQDPITHVITIQGKGKPQYIPEKEEYIRVQALESFWEFYPRDDGQVRITFQGYGEPGGSIPSSIYRSRVFRWLVEMYLWRLPYTTLSSLRQEIQKEKYNQKNIP
ncbi:START domain-containing protein [Kaarinaea lacus]